MDVIGNMNKDMRIGMPVECLALLVCIVSLSLPQWYTSDYGNAGLFKACNKFGVCFAYPKETDWLQGAQATIIMGMLVQCLCIAICLMYSYNMKDKTYLQRAAFYATLVAAVFIAVCIVITAAKISDVEEIFSMEIALGASFYLAIVSTLLCLAAGKFLYKVNPRLENDASTNVVVAIT